MEGRPIKAIQVVGQVGPQKPKRQREETTPGRGPTTVPYVRCSLLCYAIEQGDHGVPIRGLLLVHTEAWPS